MSEGTPRTLASPTAVVWGVLGGIAHAGVATLLWNYWFDDLGELLTVKPLTGAYIVLGMFLLGFVPVLCYVGERVVAPGIVVGVFLLVSVIGSWLANAVRAPATVPTPFALYILVWVGVVALAGVAGWVEYRRLHRPPG